MAHTDACKYQVCQLLEKCVQHGMSVNEASKRVQAESDGIPAKTIQRWWREIQNEAAGLPKNEQQPENPATTPVQGGDSGDKMTPQEVVKQVDAVPPDLPPPPCNCPPPTGDHLCGERQNVGSPSLEASGLPGAFLWFPPWRPPPVRGILPTMTPPFDPLAWLHSRSTEAGP